MCGRYGRRADKQRIAEWFRTRDTDVFNEEYYETNAAHFTPSYNISPETMQPVVRVDHDTGDQRARAHEVGLGALLVENAKSQFQFHQCAG